MRRPQMLHRQKSRQNPQAQRQRAPTASTAPTTKPPSTSAYSSNEPSSKARTPDTTYYNTKHSSHAQTAKTHRNPSPEQYSPDPSQAALLQADHANAQIALSRYILTVYDNEHVRAYLRTGDKAPSPWMLFEYLTRDYVAITLALYR